MVAFGGNALLRSGQKGTYQEQLGNVEQTCESLCNLLERNYNIVIGHGNGPQVGNVMLQHEEGKRAGIEAMPMDFCVAETQGSIAYMIEMGLRNVMARHDIQRQVVTLVTQVAVNKLDPMFQNPTKPVGPYYTKEQAEKLAKTTGAVYKEDPKGRGWRKVVASPKPTRINNIKIVQQLAKAGNIVVTVGGGGIPVVEESDYVRGVEAVIDKDLASALCAVQIGADEFYILTDVPKVYINFRKENEKALDTITIAEAKKYLEEGQFAEGSMAPKVRAAIMFVENGGKECIITEAGQLDNPNCGTRIVKQLCQPMSCPTKKSKFATALVVLAALLDAITILLGAIFRINHWPGGSIMLILGMGGAVWIWCAGIIYRCISSDMFSLPSGSLLFRILVGLLLLGAGFFLLMGTLFCINHWPGGHIMVTVGAAAMIVAILAELILYLHKKKTNS